MLGVDLVLLAHQGGGRLSPEIPSERQRHRSQRAPANEHAAPGYGRESLEGCSVAVQKAVRGLQGLKNRSASTLAATAELLCLLTSPEPLAARFDGWR